MSHYDCTRPALRLASRSITRDAKPNAASPLGRSDDVSEGSFLPPSLPTAMEELASTPDAKAHNRYAAL
jgi:hypothetical protein